MNKIAIAIDGPAGAGKSTIAKIVGKRLNIMYLDTGAMYRAVTLSIIKSCISTEDIDEIEKLLDNIKIDFIGERIYLNGEDVTEKIREQEVSKLVSPVAAIPQVREKLVQIQREIALNNSVVMDGRDIGTNVLKDADVKIFLTASVEERAKRRYKELINKGYKVELDSIKREISIRDEYDSNRKINPLRKAKDAFEIDTTYKSVEEVAEEIINIVKKRWDGAL